MINPEKFQVIEGGRRKESNIHKLSRVSHGNYTEQELKSFRYLGTLFSTTVEHGTRNAVGLPTFRVHAMRDFALYTGGSNQEVAERMRKQAKGDIKRKVEQSRLRMVK